MMRNDHIQGILFNQPTLLNLQTKVPATRKERLLKKMPFRQLFIKKKPLSQTAPLPTPQVHAAVSYYIIDAGDLLSRFKTRG